MSFAGAGRLWAGWARDRVAWACSFVLGLVPAEKIERNWVRSPTFFFLRQLTVPLQRFFLPHPLATPCCTVATVSCDFSDRTSLACRSISSVNLDDPNEQTGVYHTPPPPPTTPPQQARRDRGHVLKVLP